MDLDVVYEIYAYAGNDILNQGSIEHIKKDFASIDNPQMPKSIEKPYALTLNRIIFLLFIIIFFSVVLDWIKS
jgi:hypothetical protein